MHSFAEALDNLHKKGELWDHCETGVEVLPDFSIKIHGTVSERNNRLNEGDVDVNRSVAPPEYMNSGIHDVRSDIFAWGIVVYELTTGECPLKGETLVELIEAGLACNFTPVHEIKNDFPLRLSNIISKAISKEPNDRFQTAKELLESLEDKL
jgi:serine/threonine-protein kinase